MFNVGFFHFLQMSDDDDDIMEGLFENIGEESNDSPGPSKISTSKKEAQKSKVKASGSGLTFFLDSTLEDDEDDMDDYDVEDSLNNPSTSRKIIEKSMDKVSGQDSDLQKELTEKYISGQMSFNDYIKQIEDDDDDDEESDDQSGEESDDEWIPAGEKKRKVQAVSDKSIEEFSKDLKHVTKQQLGRKQSRLGVRTRNKLDPTLQGLIGEANLRFVRGDIDTAIKMCMEVIRCDARAPEPFQTLSTIYEESGEFEKSVQFAMIGAHLAPPDAEEWERLANMSLELGDLRQAASCLKKAIDSDSSVLKYHINRCNLLEEIGDKRRALQGYRRLLLCLKEDQGSDYMETAREIARLLHERGDVEAAKNAIEAAMNKFPDDVQPEYINLLLELLIGLNDYPEALQVLCTRCSTRFDGSTEGFQDLSPEEQLKKFTSVSVPDEMPLDIKAKLLVTLLNLKATHLTQPFVDQLLQSDASDFGDLMLDACEALMGQKCWADALQFAEKLVQDEDYGKAAVWLQYGECLYETQQLEEAEQAYQKVVELAPQHYEARKALSNILHKLGRPEEALHTLTQDEKAELLNPTLLYEKCQLLLKEGHTEEFIKKAKLLFSRHFTDVRSREEVITLCTSRKYAQKRIQELRSARPEDAQDLLGAAAFEAEATIKVTDEFQLMKSLCDVLYRQKRYAELQRLTVSALGCTPFLRDPEIIKEVEFLCLLSAFLNKDAHFAYNYVRDMVTKDLKNNKLWNLFNAIITDSDDQRHNKFLMRLAHKQPENVPIGLLNGNNCLLAGTYKYSLGEYMNVYKVERNNPLVPLMLGITFVHLACQKFSSKKHSLVVQGCAFLQNYAKMRGLQCHETCYNLGRAMHQLGILPAAMHYYKKVLSLPPPIQDDEDFSLVREAAFNLSLIYKTSGSAELARIIIDKHIVI